MMESRTKQENSLFNPLFWNDEHIQDSLQILYQQTVKYAQEQIDWYAKKKETKKYWSFFFRVFTILFVSLGAGAPLLELAFDRKAITIYALTIDISYSGFLLLACGAFSYSIDKYFGLSTGWMRFINTQISIERELKIFEYDWNELEIALKSETTDREEAQKFLQRAKVLIEKVFDLIQKETQEWMNEFKYNLSKLEKLLEENPPPQK